MRNIFLLTLLLVTSLYADPVCQKCERVRAENIEKAKSQNWVFYEDWLEMNGQSGSIDTEDSVKNKADQGGEEAPH